MKFWQTIIKFSPILSLTFHMLSWVYKMERILKSSQNLPCEFTMPILNVQLEVRNWKLHLPIVAFQLYALSAATLKISVIFVQTVVSLDEQPNLQKLILQVFPQRPPAVYCCKLPLKDPTLPPPTHTTTHCGQPDSFQFASSARRASQLGKYSHIVTTTTMTTISTAYIINHSFPPHTS